MKIFGAVEPVRRPPESALKAKGIAPGRERLLFFLFFLLTAFSRATSPDAP